MVLLREERENPRGLIDTGTVMFGVFGDPVKHSRSPVMLNRAFGEVGLNAAYAAFHVLPAQLKDAVGGIRSLGFRGVNVTLPHKVEVMAHLDEIDQDARVIGAVNTIVNDGGKLIGYNTDGIGYVRSLKEEIDFKLKGKNILVLGAGGAARGVTHALAKELPERIRIANRTVERAEQLARSLSDFADIEGISLHEIADVIGQVDLIVNNTPIGMHPHIDQTPLDSALLHPDVVVSDLIYNPPLTRLLLEAKDRGAVVHSGMGMFIYQGAYAFEYWTGLDAPIAAMRAAVEQSFQA